MGGLLTECWLDFASGKVFSVGFRPLSNKQREARLVLFLFPPVIPGRIQMQTTVRINKVTFSNGTHHFRLATGLPRHRPGDCKGLGREEKVFFRFCSLIS